MQFSKFENENENFFVKGYTISRPQEERRYSLWKSLHLRGELFRSAQGDFFVLLISLLCVGATSCLIIPLRGSPQPTWSLYFATVGLFAPLLITSLAWTWVYGQEQLPLDWTYLKSNNRYIVMNIKPVTGYIRSVIRVMSLIAALLAIIG